MAKVEKLHVAFKNAITDPRRVYLSNDINNLFQKTIKKIYCNDELIWQNSNAFIFTNSLESINLKNFNEFIKYSKNFDYCLYAYEETNPLDGSFKDVVFRMCIFLKTIITSLKVRFNIINIYAQHIVVLQNCIL